jgi:transcriptional regulator with XRE-family HTH domain
MIRHLSKYEQQVAKSIKDKRLELGLTQAEFAERLVLGRTSVTNMESGLQKCLAHVYLEICDLTKNDLGVKRILKEKRK